MHLILPKASHAVVCCLSLQEADTSSGHLAVPFQQLHANNLSELN